MQRTEAVTVVLPNPLCANLRSRVRSPSGQSVSCMGRIEVGGNVSIREHQHLAPAVRSWQCRAACTLLHRTAGTRDLEGSEAVSGKMSRPEHELGHRSSSPSPSPLGEIQPRLLKPCPN